MPLSHPACTRCLRGGCTGCTDACPPAGGDVAGAAGRAAATTATTAAPAAHAVEPVGAVAATALHVSPGDAPTAPVVASWWRGPLPRPRSMRAPIRWARTKRLSGGASRATWAQQTRSPDELSAALEAECTATRRSYSWEELCAAYDGWPWDEWMDAAAAAMATAPAATAPDKAASAVATAAAEPAASDAAAAAAAVAEPLAAEVSFAAFPVTAAVAEPIACAAEPALVASATNSAAATDDAAPAAEVAAPAAAASAEPPSAEPLHPPPVGVKATAPAGAGPRVPDPDYFTAFTPHGESEVQPEGNYYKSPHGWSIYNHPELTPELLEWFEAQLTELLPRVMAYDLTQMPGYSGVDGELEIVLTTDKPIREGQRRYSPAELEIGDAKLDELRQVKFVVPAPPTCQHASNVTMPAKKDADGQWTDRRCCTDYRAINSKSVIDRYGLHRPEDMLRRVSKGKYFSKADLRQAFLNVVIKAEDRPKTAFWWRNQLWMYVRMPYGLASGSAKFQRIMDLELAAAGLTDVASAFIDDLAVSSGPEGGLKGHMLDVLRTLRALGSKGLRFHPFKCWFLLLEPDLLGYRVVPGGLAPAEAKVAAIRALTPPATLVELRSKLAFVNYYRTFIPNFSIIAAPLNELLRKNATWVWGPRQEAAFAQLKEIVCTPGIVLRNFEPDATATILYTDWSKVGIAAVLHQKDAEGQEYLVACLSRSLNPHERNYGSYEGELLAAVWGIRSFRIYLHGVRFLLITDHQPLKWLMANQELTGKPARWALAIQEYSFEVQHRPGAVHINADVLSRYPLPSTADSTGARLDPYVTPAAALAAFASHFSVAAEPLLCAVPTSFDSFIPDQEELFSELPSWVGEDCPALAVGSAKGLLAAADRWVCSVADALAGLHWAPQPLALGQGSADCFGVSAAVEQLCTSPVGLALFAAAEREGIVLYEPFGGMCAGLDMVLTCGLRVQQYYYSDLDWAAQQVARQRVTDLHAQYPHLFPLAASAGAFDALPMNVQQVNTADLVRAGAGDGPQWLVVAGWSCEDLSPAGTGRGLQGARSSNFWDAVRIVGALQQLQVARPPAYICENTAMQVSFGHAAVREHDFPRICEILGEPVLLDAAQVGSRAHRLRNYWTNIMPAVHVSLVLGEARRAPGRLVDAVLDPGRFSRPLTRPLGTPFYQCDHVGEPLQALPTLVAYPGSWAFRNEGAGMLWDEGAQCLVEPNPDERERILGYTTGCTRVAGVSDVQRHAITGRAMDRHAMVHLLAACKALTNRAVGLLPSSVWAPGRWHWEASKAVGMLTQWGWQPGGPLLSPHARDPLLEPVCITGNEGTMGLGYKPSMGDGEPPAAAVANLVRQFEGSLCVNDGCCGEHAWAAAGELQGAAGVYSEGELHQHYCHLADQAAVQDTAEKPLVSGADPHLDLGLLHFLQEGAMPTGAGPREAARIRRRAVRYSWVDGELQRRMADGSRRTVPLPEAREGIVRETHERTGHWGQKRTKHLVLASWWWPQVEADVVRVLGQCEACARIKASFNAERPQLQPLPINGLFYRWGVDMAGPFAESRDGNTYVLIMIEYFSKTIEVAAVKEKLARSNAHVFLSAVLSRYGACAEVVTDRGSEFDGEFHQLLAECLIDHRTTSANHPQADGLAERAVQSIKKALAKHVAQHRQLGDWDWELQWIVLGYRASRQAASGLSPYQILYGTQPIIPPAIKERVDEPVLDFADAEQAAQYLLLRAEALKAHCAIAFSNERIAQHRDELRYEQVRSGAYLPTRAKFMVGDFVYVRRRTVVNSLQSEAGPAIFRIVEVLPTGVLVLQGRCGTTMKVNCTECAPCHLTNINPALDPRLQAVAADFPCSVCNSPEDEAVMLICDGCGQGYHIYCLQPPLASVPSEEVWLCAVCVQQGVTAEAVQLLRQQGLPVAQSDAAVFPSVQQRAQDAAAQALQGQAVWLPDLSMQGTLEYVPRVDRQLHSRSPLRVVLQGRPPVYLSLRKAERLVKEGLPTTGGQQAAAAQLPAGLAAVFVAAVGSGDEASGGARVQAGMLSDLEVAQAIRDWCEGDPSGELVAAAQAAYAGLAAEGEQGVDLDITGEHMGVLLQAIDLQLCVKLVVAGGNCAAVRECMLQRYNKQLWDAKDKQPGRGADLVSPAWYKQVQVRRPLDWVFLQPTEGLVELALGLAARQARRGVAMLVPRATLTNRSGLLTAMLQRFCQQGRLVCLTSEGNASAWVVVFATQHDEQHMVSVRGRVHTTGWVLEGLPGGI